MLKSRQTAVKGVHSRGYLPHIEGADFQFITYRLADALPKTVLERLRCNSTGATKQTDVERAMDEGYGCCCLTVPAIAECVVENWWHFDGQRYDLLAYVVMPNHVHVLIRVYEGVTLSRIVHSWKSYTSKRILAFAAIELGAQAAQLYKLQQARKVWQPEYWDRYIRDENHFKRAVRYILENPAKGAYLPRGKARRVKISKKEL